MDFLAKGTHCIPICAKGPLAITPRLKGHLEIQLVFCSIQIGRKLVTARSILQKQSSK